MTIQCNLSFELLATYLLQASKCNSTKTNLTFSQAGTDSISCVEERSFPLYTPSNASAPQRAIIHVQIAADIKWEVIKTWGMCVCVCICVNVLAC